MEYIIILSYIKLINSVNFSNPTSSSDLISSLVISSTPGALVVTQVVTSVVA